MTRKELLAQMRVQSKNKDYQGLLASAKQETQLADQRRAMLKSGKLNLGGRN